VIRQEWHIEADDLAGYAAGTARPTARSSIEAHLVACEVCRLALNDQVARVAYAEPGYAAQGDAAANDGATEDRMWSAIVDRVDGGTRTLARSSRLLHVSVSSPPLALATTLLAGLLMVFVCVARAGAPRYATTVLVALGPLVPLIGAGLAFGRHVDPAGAMATSAPLAASRVAAARALIVTIVACAVGVVVSPLTTMGPGDSVVWLLPALAVTAVTVAISTYVDSTVPTVAFALGWLVIVGSWLSDVPRAVRGVSTEGLASDRPAVQAALVIATIAAVAMCFARRDSNPDWRSAP
jgi:hypothetical protein